MWPSLKHRKAPDSDEAHMRTHKFTHTHTQIYTRIHIYTRAHTHMRQKSVAKKCRQKSVVCARAFFQKSARAHMQNLQQRVRYTLVTLTQAKRPCAHTCETGSSGTVVNDDGVCHWECVRPFESSNVACMIYINPLMGNVFSLYTLSWDPPTTQAKHSVC